MAAFGEQVGSPSRVLNAGVRRPLLGAGGNFRARSHVCSGMGETQKATNQEGRPERRSQGPGGRAAEWSVVVVVATGVVVAACGSSSPKPVAAKPSCGGSAPKLTVQGTGLASGTPDLLTVSVGIDVTDPTANAALADDNTKATAVIDGPRPRGASRAKDVQTSDVSINPQYNSKGVITGYKVTNTLTAKLRNFTTAGSVIDSIAGAAGNATRLDSLTFSVEDTRALEDRARTDAVHQAVSPRPVDGPGGGGAARAGLLAHRPVPDQHLLAPGLRLLGAAASPLNKDATPVPLEAGFPTGDGPGDDGLRAPASRRRQEVRPGFSSSRGPRHSHDPGSPVSS